MTTAPVLAGGLNKRIAMAQETTWGVQGSGSGQALRRTNLTLTQTVQAIESAEIRSSGMGTDVRHGPFQVSGRLSAQLMPNVFSWLLESLARATYTAGVVIAAIADASLAYVSSNPVLSSPSDGAFISSGVKRGDIVRLSALTGGPAANNGVNLRVMAETATALTFAPPAIPLTTWSTGQSPTLTVAGKKLFPPPAPTVEGFASVSFEEWYADVQQSYVYTGCVVTGVTLAIPASGFATVQFSIIGQALINTQTQQYPSATAVDAYQSLTPLGGQVIYEGAPVGIISTANIQIQSTAQADPVVGSNIIPAIFQGMFTCRGTMTALFANDTMMTDFLLENEVDLAFTFMATTASGSNFMSLYLPRCKLMSNNRNDSDRAIMRSLSFTAMEQINGGTGTYWDETLFTFQDSQATT